MTPQQEPGTIFVNRPSPHVTGATALLMATCPIPLATWYDYPKPRITSNGDRFDGSGFTAAHHSLPFGTLVLITYQGRSIAVRITDRMPIHGCRVIDLTKGVARWLGIDKIGVAPVGMTIVTAVPEYP